jgi:hypothetical protein
MQPYLDEQWDAVMGLLELAARARNKEPNLATIAMDSLAGWYRRHRQA